MRNITDKDYSDLVRARLNVIAINIKRLRGKMSQQEFAKKVGVSRTTISRIENAQNFEVVSLLMIAEEYGLQPYSLCMTEEQKVQLTERVNLLREELYNEMKKNLKEELAEEIKREIVRERK